MGAWISNLSLKYKFWAVNAVAFAITLMLVLFALHIERSARIDDARQAASQQARLLQQWPAQSPLPQLAELKVLDQATGQADTSGWQALQHDAWFSDSPSIGTQRFKLADGRQAALQVKAPSLLQLFGEHAASYALAVALLMLLLLAASQLLIRFLLSHLNTLKDVMLQAERSGDLSLRVPLSSRDEVGQMAAAFNAMQAGYQRVVGTVGQVAGELDSGTSSLARHMGSVRQGMLAQQSETDQAATAINEMSATVQHIAEHASTTRDQSLSADQLARAGQQVVERVEQSIDALSQGVRQSAGSIERLAEDSQRISQVVAVIHGIAEQTNLLALNAAIEAARAGEMGRGFAVVADEVRNLAKRVQSSTDEITQMIGNLQGGTRDAVEFMRESSENATHCVQLAQEAGESLAAITAAVALMRESNTQIAVAANQQSQVAEEMSRSVVGIRDVTEQTVGQTLESAATSQQLAELAGQLSRAIGQLKL
ncbi:methyl-accepting chemotaxis protein [Pseudomonas sp. GOM7]|uniref:methyl-accepting chemotaxis protein n=2 Tax=unclassified Pseudomonas TaxID=196821 RepID=UPI00227C6743|nr:MULTISPECIES: methyl-accepting chemotaxis protein [unclassified Pseudomonas]WAJ35535.1 methyl-accepting chemotaxis protein [Pseudomonas sp. GOM7]